MSLAHGLLWLSSVPSLTSMKTLRKYRVSCCVALLCLSCEQGGDKAGQRRSEAVSSASQQMSGPSLFSSERLTPALQAMRAKASGRLLRLEIRAHEIALQAEDTATPGAVVELHFRDGKVGELEHATLRGKGVLADNLFDPNELKLDAIPALTSEALRRIDAEAGSVDYVLARRNLPESDELRLRVYVSSPRKSGYVDADRNGTPLL
jgi:hypothetical protein